MSILYFDGNCPLCLRTVDFIKMWIDPKDVYFSDLNTSTLEGDTKRRAFDEMLLIAQDGSFIWGYKTYSKILRLSKKRYSFILLQISNFMLLPGINVLGNSIYKRIALSRLRCDDSSCIV